MLLKRKFLLLCFIISILLFVSSCSGINTQPRFQDQNQDNRGDYMDEADSGKDVAEAGSIKIGGMKEEAVPVQKTDHKKDDAKKDDSNDEIKPTPDSDAEGGNASVSDHSSKNEATKEQASPAPSSDTISSDTKNDLDLTSNNSSSKNEGTKDQASPAPSAGTKSNDTKNDAAPTSNSSKNEGTKDQASPAPSSDTKSSVTKDNASPKPGAVSNLKMARASSSTAKLSWTAGSGAASYEVQYNSPVSGGWKTDPDYKTKTSTSYTTTDLVLDREYQFRVRSVNANGKSDWVTVKYTHKEAAKPKPGAVSNLKMTRASSSTAKLSWTAGSGAASYEVQYYSQASGGWKTDPDYKTKTSTSYTTTDLVLGREYQFRVRSVNANGKSDWVTVKYTHKEAATSKPGKVSNLKVKGTSSATAKLSWTAGSGAASYEVQYYSQASGGWKTDPDYKTKTSKSYTTTGLTLGKEYQFRVRSVNAGGKSDWVTIKFTHAFTYNPSDPAPGADQAIKWAKNQLGKNDWNGYCLAFVSQAYSSAGISSSVSGRLPDAKTAANKYKPVKKGEPPKGAVVFFDWWGTVKGEYANWGHVGIYIGNDKFIHAENGVKTSTFSSYYMKKNGDYLGWAIWGQ
jgi:cell wall-associated NlpC family hydrolase